MGAPELAVSPVGDYAQSEVASKNWCVVEWLLTCSSVGSVAHFFKINFDFCSFFRGVANSVV